MFIENASRFEVKLSRGTFEDQDPPPLALDLIRGAATIPDHDVPERAFATVVVHEAFDLTTSQPLEATLPSSLKNAFTAHITNGTSVTVDGMIEGSPRGRLARAVRLQVGADTVELVCRSPRTWTKLHGRWVATAPIPFDAFPMSWTEAFGGTVDVPPGLDPVSRLPGPGFSAPHPYNPQGRGHLLDERDAEGVSLPRIELMSDQLQSPTGQPIPGGIAPCPELASMRWRNPHEPRMLFPREAHESPFAPCHAGPLHCIFDDLAPGSSVAWSGLVGSTNALAVPSPRSTVRWDGARRGHTGRRIRAVHIDLEAGCYHLLVQHAVLMPQTKLPRSVVVSEVSS